MCSGTLSRGGDASVLENVVSRDCLRLSNRSSALGQVGEVLISVHGRCSFHKVKDRRYESLQGLTPLLRGNSAYDTKVAVPAVSNSQSLTLVVSGRDQPGG